MAWWSVGSLLLIIALLTGLRPLSPINVNATFRMLRSGTTAPSWPLRYYLPIVALIVCWRFNSVCWNGCFCIHLLGIVVIAFLLGVVIGWFWIMAFKAI